LKRAQVRIVTVFFMIYILVSGGSFGIEDMVSSSGPGLTLILLILLPIFWSLPMALLGNLALCLDYLASGARPLFAIAADGLFPRSIATVSKRFGTPIAAILLMAVLNAVLIVGLFRNLVVIDVILFISAYVLIFISAVRLRLKEPDLKRPFRVPCGTAGMVAMVVPPVLIVVFTIYVNAIDRSTELFGFTGFKLLGANIGWYGIAGFVALSSGPVLYYVFRALYGGPVTPAREAGNDALALAEAEAVEDAA
jgi:amino acid transporter